jgi:acyl-coenzyme A synthetase/AMP-(fatty) acid ligase
MIILTGRRDRIIKVHGYRVHLNEIETMVLEISGISETVAVPSTTASGDTT